MPNPLVDDLTDEAKAWLAVKFAELAANFPPIRFEHVYGHTFMRPVLSRRPWQI